jgi:hypothetical protein
MTITLSTARPGADGLRKIHASVDAGPVLTTGFISPVFPELAVPGGPQFTSALWAVAGIRNAVTPRCSHAGPQGRTPEEIMGALEARVAAHGPWWAWVTPDDIAVGTVIRIEKGACGLRPYGLQNTGRVSQSRETGAITLTGMVLAQDGTTTRRRPLFRDVIVMPHQITILRQPGA